MTSADEALRYHARSTHHPGRFAASLGYLDWDTQPDPFRAYAGAEAIDLPLAADGLAVAFADLERPGAVPSRPLDLESVAVLFELSLGLSAWKAHGGASWALRCNPSSGNLHPTEGYLVTAGLAGLPPGVYHYVSRDHRLERRCDGDLGGVLPPGSLLVGLASVYWREAWKYGERAYRYCQHDAGHALAAVRYAAAALGWHARLLAGASDGDLARLLGLDREEDHAGLDPLDRESAELALLVTAEGPAITDGADLVARLATRAAEGRWAGRPNALSPEHLRWDAVEGVASAARKPATREPLWTPEAAPAPMERPAPVPAATLVRGRRSAVALDGLTGVGVGALHAILDRLVPRAGVPPWDALPWPPRVHLLLFAHRVDGLTPGLYLLARNDSAQETLRAVTRPGFRWTRPDGTPPHLRLVQLAEGDVRDTAEIVSCRQAIAADGAFAAAMLAEFGETIRGDGAFWYRRLHWEAGVLGQVLYLEAEAAGLRGTGIGCFFDALVHDLLGLADDRFRTLYHFAVGGPVEDPRLRTLPPYAHLTGRTRRARPR